MIDKQIAVAQIARIKGLPFFPAKEDKAAQMELVSALQVAANAEIATRVIDSIANDDTLERCPIPAVIRGLCYEKNETSQQDKEPKYCSACKQQHGWVISYWLVTTEVLDSGTAHTRKEKLPFSDAVSEYYYKKQLTAIPKHSGFRQEVYSAAERCGCTKVAA